MNDNVRYWIATAPVGAASVLAEELAQFDAEDIRERSHDVKFQGTLEVGYRACLWSRTATRVLLSLGSIDAGSSKSVYEAVKRIDWREHLAPGATLACDCSGGNESIRHTLYGSQLLKDAVCENPRDATGEVIEPKAAARRSRRTSPPRCCCARAGRASVNAAARSSIPCAVPAPFS